MTINLNTEDISCLLFPTYNVSRVTWFSSVSLVSMRTLGFYRNNLIKQLRSTTNNHIGETGTCKKLTLSPWGPVGPFALLSSPCSPYTSNKVTEKKENQWTKPNSLCKNQWVLCLKECNNRNIPILFK